MPVSGSAKGSNKKRKSFCCFFPVRELKIAHMKKLLGFAVIAIVSAAVLVGCKKEEEPMAPQAPPAMTNAPAAP